ncbi:MAG TPA: alpha/beta fold hydrolase, partial [Herpetosiphonaceae bacterium]
QLPLAILFQSATIEHLAALLRSDTDVDSWSHLVPMQTSGSQPPLFCVPGAGGNVIGFYGLARRLDVDRPIYGLQARGLDGESAPHTSVAEMAADYIAAMRTVQPEGPYYVCGYSFGSWVAFEITQQLQRQGQEVALLAILNTPTPMVMSDDPAYRTQPRSTAHDEITTILAVARSLERTFGVDLALTRDRLEPLSADEQITLLAEQLKQANILPAEAKTRHVRGFVNVFKTNYDITYVPEDWQPTRIVLFRASERLAEDDDVPLILRDDPAWGWNQFAAAPVDVHFVPGEHLTILTEPHVQTLVAELGRYLR